MAGSSECGDEYSGSGAMNLLVIYVYSTFVTKNNFHLGYPSFSV
jgi:hypothetical protein